MKLVFAAVVLVSAMAERSFAQNTAGDITINNIIGVGDASNVTGGCGCRTDLLMRILELLEPRHNDSASNLDNDTAVTEPPANETYPRDCKEYFDRGFNTSGVYTVTLTPDDATTNTEAYCDMTTDGGGWTVFQRHMSDEVSFNQSWDAYKLGFGSINANFWWGNEKLALSVNDARFYDLRFDLFDWAGAHRYAKYAQFRVFGEQDNYRLNFGAYSGNAGNSLAAHNNNRQFSTPDRDNDVAEWNCANGTQSGFWFGWCSYVLVNSPYSSSSDVEAWQGLVWLAWHGSTYSLQRVEMKFRAAN